MTTSLAHSGAAAFRPPFPKNLPSNIMQTSGHKCFANSQKIAYIKNSEEQHRHSLFANLHFLMTVFAWLPCSSIATLCGMHSHAGAWEREIKLLPIFLSELEDFMHIKT